MNKPPKPRAGKRRRLASGPPPPVVLQVLPSLVTGGVERGTVDIAAALAEHDVPTFVASSGGPMERELTRAGATHITLPVHSKNPLVMRANVGRLVQVIEQHGIELVHARSRAPAWSAFRAARRTGKPFVTTFHGTYGAGNMVKRLYNSVMARGDHVIAISEFIAEHIRNRYKTDPDKIVVVQRGVDTEIFDPAAVAQPRVIKLIDDWRLPDGVPVVMLPGRLTRWKGHTVFLEALAKLGRDDLCAVIVGDPQGRASYMSELETIVRERGLEAVVRLVGHSTDMPAVFMAADFVVSASTDPEAFGRVIAEAGAMGRPVIASDHGGASEQIVDGRTGWLVPPGDPDALAAAIDRALDIDQGKRAMMADAAMRRVRRNFSKETMCRQTLAVYQSLCSADEVADA